MFSVSIYLASYLPIYFYGKHGLLCVPIFIFSLNFLLVPLKMFLSVFYWLISILFIDQNDWFWTKEHMSKNHSNCSLDPCWKQHTEILFLFNPHVLLTLKFYGILFTKAGSWHIHVHNFNKTKANIAVFQEVLLEILIKVTVMYRLCIQLLLNSKTVKVTVAFTCASASYSR